MQTFFPMVTPSGMTAFSPNGLQVRIRKYSVLGRSRFLANAHHNMFADMYVFCNNGLIDLGSLADCAVAHNNRISYNNTLFNAHPAPMTELCTFL